MDKTVYLRKVTAVSVMRERVVHLTFDDGLAGEVDLGPHLWGPVFEELARDDAAFGRIFIDYDTIAWENGADMAPETLYADVKAANAARAAAHH